MTSRIVVPIRVAAWLSGELGRSLEAALKAGLRVPELRLTRLPRTFLVEAREAPGVLLEAVHRAVLGIEEEAARSHPVFHNELGPVWTGTLQVVFVDASSSL